MNTQGNVTFISISKFLQAPQAAGMQLTPSYHERKSKQLHPSSQGVEEGVQVPDEMREGGRGELSVEGKHNNRKPQYFHDAGRRGSVCSFQISPFLQ